MSLKYRAKISNRNNPVKEYDNGIALLFSPHMLSRRFTKYDFKRRGEKRIYDGNNFRSSQEFIRHRALLTTTIS